jgi:deoxyribonuclease-4
MPRLIGAHCSIAGGLRTAAERAGALKCNTIQIFTKNNNQWEAAPLLAREISDFQAACSKNGVRLAFAHAGYLINLAAVDEAVHERSMLSMRQELERAEALEMPYLVAHPGSHKGAEELAGVLQAAASLDRLIEETEGFRVQIVLETTAGQGNSLGCRFEHFAEIMSRLSKMHLRRIGICIDTAHIFSAGYDLSTPFACGKVIKEFDRTIGLEHLKVIHLNDSMRECASRVDRHEHLGRGKIGLATFKWLLNDKRFINIPTVIETPKGATLDADRRNLKLIKSLIRQFHSSGQGPPDKSGSCKKGG